MDGFEKKLELISPENTSYAILDPENILFDIDPTNHTTRKRGISIPLFFDQPDFHAYYLGTITPSFTINSENFGTGFTLRRGSNPLENINYIITPSFDVNGNNPLAEMSVGWREFRKLGFDLIRTNLGYFNTQSRETFRTNAEFIIREPIVRYPYFKIKIAVDLHLKLPSLYTTIEGEKTTSHRFEISYKDKPTVFTNYEIKSNFNFVKQGSDKFAGIRVSGKLKYQIN